MFCFSIRRNDKLIYAIAKIFSLASGTWRCQIKMKKIISFIVIFLLVLILCFYRLEYYVMKPGSAYDVSQFVNVQDGDYDDEGAFNLMTVAMFQATPITYIIAYFNEFQDILEIQDVRHEEEDEEEYNVRQLKLMTDSQFNALYVAFKKAEQPFTVQYNGITVLNVLSGGAADGKIEPGDEIVEIDGQIIHKAEDLTAILNAKKKDEKVQTCYKSKQ